MKRRKIWSILALAALTGSLLAVSVSRSVRESRLLMSWLSLRFKLLR